MSLRRLFSRRTSSSSSQTYDLPRRASSFSEVSQTPHGAEALAALDRGKFAGAWEHNTAAVEAWRALALAPGDCVRIEIERDAAAEGRGAPNAVPVAGSAGVRWNVGGWIDARVASVDAAAGRASLLVEMGHMETGHAGPAAFMSKKDVVRAHPLTIDGDALWLVVAARDNLAERPIALLVYARWSVRKPRVPARLDVGEVVRFELQRDDGGAGAANGVPVLYPGVRWNAGGWIEARVTAAGEHVVEAQILDGELDYGHAGPNAFHRARPLDTRVPMRVTGDSLLFALAAPTADDAPLEVSIVDRWAMRRVAAPMLVVQGPTQSWIASSQASEGEVSAEVSLSRRAIPR